MNGGREGGREREGRQGRREGRKKGGEEERKEGREEGGEEEVSPFLLRVPCLYSSLQQTHVLVCSFLQKPRVVDLKSRRASRLGEFLPLLNITPTV